MRYKPWLKMLKNIFFLLFLHFFFLFVGVFKKNMYLCNQKLKIRI